MSRNKASIKRKEPPGVKVSGNASFLKKLELLRNFVPNTSDDDLSGCLRQCGHNVQLAAERLMTGQYTSSKQATTAPRRGAKSNFFQMSTASPSKQTKKTPFKRQGKLLTSSSCASTKARASARKTTPKLPPVARVSTSPFENEEEEAQVNDNNNNNSYLLCQRWIVGNCTFKSGKTIHKEALALESTMSGPPMVRFKGANIEGTLQINLCEMMAPLLRAETKLITLEAQALMSDERIPIGGEVPISLSIYIPDPRAFFAVFDDDAKSPTSSAAMFFNAKNKAAAPKRRKVKNMALAEAAFCLLQYAEYGDEPVVPKTTTTSQQADSSSESDEEQPLLSEDQFEAEDKDDQDKNDRPAEWAEKVVDQAASTEALKNQNLPEADDPKGLANGVTLRPYQRQALAWMVKRETDSDNRADLENELVLLTELAKDSNKSSRPRMNVYGDAEKEVSCECGPVLVSNAGALKSKTIDGVVNPVNHPLWQRRYLATGADKETSISFYVNELIGVATASAPNPPRQCVGGMLCDAMGLGKTVMLLSLLMMDKESTATESQDDEAQDSDEEVWVLDPNKRQKMSYKTTLVVAPLSLIAQWEEEVATKSNLTHRVYYGDTATGMIGPKSFEGVDVVVTTYGTMQGELHAMTKKGATNTGLLSHGWHRVILDESHVIKNPSTLVARACCMLKAERRWAVTGTPIQNSLQDVYALLKFLRHEPWCESGFWRAAITSAMNVKEDDDKATTASSQNDKTNGEANGAVSPTGMMIALDRVRRLLSPLILRRTKNSVDKDGKPILTLPPVETKVITVKLSIAEREFYNSLLHMSQSVFEGFIEAGTASKSWFQIFSFLHRLRQACDHVALTVKTHVEDWDPAGGEQQQQQQTQKKKAAAAAAAKASPKPPANRDGIANEGFIKELLEKFQARQSCETENDGENKGLSYATKVAKTLLEAVKAGAETIEDECPICLENPKIHQAVITPCAHVFCKDCLVGFLKENGPKVEKPASKLKFALQCPDGKCPTCNDEIQSRKIITLSESSEGRTVTRFLTDNKSTTLVARPKEESVQDAYKTVARQTLENALGGAGSAKLSAILAELDRVWDQDPGSKVLIYSQFLGFLDLIGGALGQNGIPHSRLDGQMSLKERVGALDKFREHTTKTSNKRGSVLLVSMRAGGVGINLVAASTVFIVDPWWNAAVEDQCINRIHRIGQTAELVRVRKFVVENSVEERIVQLQKRKEGMASEVLNDANPDGGLSSSNTRPTLDDLKLLFGRNYGE